jgi:hypothetical protein
VHTGAAGVTVGLDAPSRSSEEVREMSAYVPVLVWVLSAFICLWIAKARHVRATTPWAILVAILGPFAIPLVFLARPDETQQTNQHG